MAEREACCCFCDPLSSFAPVRGDVGTHPVKGVPLLWQSAWGEPTLVLADHGEGNPLPLCLLRWRLHIGASNRVRFSAGLLVWLQPQCPVCLLQSSSLGRCRLDFILAYAGDQPQPPPGALLYPPLNIPGLWLGKQAWLGFATAFWKSSPAVRFQAPAGRLHSLLSMQLDGRSLAGNHAGLDCLLCSSSRV